MAGFDAAIGQLGNPLHLFVECSYVAGPDRQTADGIKGAEHARQYGNIHFGATLESDRRPRPIDPQSSEQSPPHAAFLPS